MIEKYEDLDSEFAKMIIKKGDVKELEDQIDSILQNKLEVSLSALKQELSQYMVTKSNDLVQDLRNIAPLGDYANMLEHKDKMEHFLKEEAHKEEHWAISRIDLVKDKQRKSGVFEADIQLIQFNFSNLAIDDGDSVKGFVFVDFNGKIKHRFANVG